MTGFNETDLGKACRDLVESMIGEIHTCMPGKIESYDYTRQKATVTPLLRRPYLDGSNVDYEPILEVPVVFPSSGSASITFPLNAGDTILLVFSERSLENWLPAGGKVNTSIASTHSVADAIAIPGLFPLNHTGAAANNTDLQVKLGSQKITIKANGDIEIGGTLTQALMTESYKTTLELYLAGIQNLLAAILALAGGATPPVTPWEVAVNVLISAFITAFPTGLVPPVNSLTSKVTAQ